MRWVHLTVIVVFAGATLIFAVQNFETITMAFLGFSIRMPLALMAVIIYLLGMATGGSGDILAGMVGCMVCLWNRRYHGVDLQQLADYIAASVYLHGLAGDLAADEHGMEGMIATDLVPHIPGAFRRVLRDR